MMRGKPALQAVQMVQNLIAMKYFLQALCRLRHGTKQNDN